MMGPSFRSYKIENFYLHDGKCILGDDGRRVVVKFVSEKSVIVGTLGAMNPPKKHRFGVGLGLGVRD